MRASFAAAAAAIVFFCNSADAAVSPETKCRASKYAAAGKYVSALLKCSGTAAKLGGSVDPACLDTASAALTAAFAAADTAAGTPCDGEVSAAQTPIDEMFAGVVATTGDGTCAAAKHKAVAKGGAGVLKAYAKSILKSASSTGAALAKAEEKIEASFAKAGACGTATASTAFQLLHAAVDAAAVCLASESACTSVSETAAPGGEVTTDPLGEGATAANPVTTSIVSPTGGDVTITHARSELPPPAGYSALGVQVAVSAPDASVSDPLVITLRLDSSLIPPPPSYVRLTRNGEVVVPCSDTSGAAAPDPCEASREVLADGDLSITARSSRASVWTQAAQVISGAPCSLAGTWTTGSYDFHLEEKAGGSVRVLSTYAVPGIDPYMSLEGDLIRSTPSTMVLRNWTNGGSTLGTIDAACQNMYFPDLTGAAPALTRVATSYCGDGTVDAGEQCDDGNDASADGCNPYSADPDIATVMLPVPPFGMVRVFFEYVVSLCVTAPVACGNGTIEGGEECDDGNMFTHDGCQPDCTATCGNGAIDDDTTLPDLEEACDDDNTVAGDGCSPTCQIEAP